MMVILKGSLLNLFIAELKVNKIATDPHRYTFTLLNPPPEGCQRQHLTGQASSLADPAKEEGVIASRY